MTQLFGLNTGPLTNLSKPTVSAPLAFYCDGAGFPTGASGVVAGRIGANQANAPYLNPFGSGVLCQNAAAVGHFSNGVTGSCPSGSNSNPSTGCPDGYQALTTTGAAWQHGITVWRNNSYTPVFDSAYVYRLSPLPANGAESVDVTYGSTANGTMIQQWGTYNGASQMFNLLPDGSYWHIAMNANNSKCIDLVGTGSSLGNGTHLMINDCKAGALSQEWSVTADAQTGGFVFKNAQAGRCLDEPTGNVSNGVQMDIWDCSGMANQKFSVQAVPLN